MTLKRLTAAAALAAVLARVSLPAQGSRDTYGLYEAQEGCVYRLIQDNLSWESAWSLFTKASGDDTVILDSSGKVAAIRSGMAVAASKDAVCVFTTANPGGSKAYVQNGSVMYCRGTLPGGDVVASIAGFTGQIPSKDVILIPWAFCEPRTAGRYSFDYYAATLDGDLVHAISRYRSSDATTSVETITVGRAPDFMEPGVRHYSTDSMTYYLSPRDAASERDPAGSHLIYYKYLSLRTVTAYTAKDLSAYAKWRSLQKSPSVASGLIGCGTALLAVQRSCGINAAMELAFACHESAWGKSALALERNNFFGVGAADSDPGKAVSYATPAQGITAHASSVLGRGYLDAGAVIDPSKDAAYYMTDRETLASYSGDSRYFGAYPGDKASGVNVRYASDPWHGEKIASHMYAIDKALGMLDYGRYSIALARGGVEILASPSEDSRVLYRAQAKSLSPAQASQGPATVALTVIGEENGYYRIVSDMPVNGDGLAFILFAYTPAGSVGYVRTGDAVIMHQGSDPQGFTENIYK